MRRLLRIGLAKKNIKMTVAKNTYKNYMPAGQEIGVLPLVENSRVLEIGFGSGKLLRELCLKGNDVYGVDVGKDIVENAKNNGLKNVYLVDISDQPMPFGDDFFDAVYCYEVFEHLTNPYKLFSEIRRILKPNHNLYFSVPTQEHTMGYGPNRHSFVYPGLLERKNLERFFMQMYFKIEYYKENNAGIIYHRNYILNNMKQLGLPDIMDVIIGDYSISQLYETILPHADLQREIQRETESYVNFLELVAKKNNWELFEQAINIFLPLHKDYLPLFVNIANILFKKGCFKGTESILIRSQKIQNIPETVSKRINDMILCISSSKL